jgi:cell wall-associated NlpC family hydrolase
VEGTTYAGAASLMDAEGPAQLLERAALLDAAGAHRSDQVATFTTARQEADAADAAAEASLQQAGALQQQAAAALAVAQTKERAARDTAAAVTAQQSDLQERADAARAELVALVGEQQAAERVKQQEDAAAAANSRSSRSPGPSTVVRTEAGEGSDSAVDTAIAAAQEYLGTSYSWGGGGAHGPGLGIDLDADVVGFDCSGLTQYAYYRAGVLIPRNSRSQFTALPKVARADLQRGDLVFWATDPSDPETIHHVAIYLGGNKVIQAPESGDVVKISPIWWSGYAGAVRPSA